VKKMAKKKELVPFNQIKILYANYELIPLEERQASLREIMGQFHSREQIIEYDSSLKNSEKVNTILHEIGHGICHTMGMKFKNEDGEEDFVNTYTAGLVTVFKDNPNLLAWVLECLTSEDDD
jgi:Zn-dependent peptidase ImmA (M78 family)